MKNYILLSSLFSFIAITACDSGFMGEVITGKYTYTSSGSYSRYIDYDSKRIIDDIVIKYSHDEKYIYALRQVTNDYICNPDNVNKISSKTEVTETFEYWIVDITSGNIHGPLDQISFTEFVILTGQNNKPPLPTIDDAIKSHITEQPRELFDCDGAERIDNFRLQKRRNPIPSAPLIR